jgi:hypothetical protein
VLYENFIVLFLILLEVFFLLVLFLLNYHKIKMNTLQFNIKIILIFNKNLLLLQKI